MVESRGPGGKGKAPVKVYHFPKRGRPRVTQDIPLNDPPALRPALPEIEEPDDTLPDDDERTPTPTPTPTPTARPRRRRTPRPATGQLARPAGKGEGKGRSKTPPRRKAVLELDPDQLPTIKTRALRTDPPISAPHKSMSRAQIAEMSLFGHHLFESGQLDEARVVFEGIVDLGVQDAFPHTMLGTVYLAQGDPARALALFEAALAIDSKDIAARVYRGEIRLSAGKLRLALEDLHKSLELGAEDDPFVERARRLIRMAEDRARRGRR